MTLTYNSSHPPKNDFVELAAASNFSFLRGASHPEELVVTAAALGAPGFALCDRNTLAGVVRAHLAGKEVGIRTVVGCRLVFRDGTPDILAWPTDRAAYGRLCRLLTVGNMRGKKDDCRLDLKDLIEWCEGLILALVAETGTDAALATAAGALAGSDEPLRLAINRPYGPNDQRALQRWARLCQQLALRPLATNLPLYHAPERRPLQDVLTAVREHTTVDAAGRLLAANAERHLKSSAEMARLFATIPEAVGEGANVMSRIAFSLDELRYEYPEEPTDPGRTPQQTLVRLALEGAAKRYPGGVPERVQKALRHELDLIEGLDYAPYFLTVYDIVRFARDHGILAQGRGSAANSAVCFCLGVTEVDPDRADLLFERFISPERREPPDIDVDFEHERREEVIQYIYEKYGRDRAGIAATVITYRARSAAREVGKALGLTEDAVGAIAGSIWGWSAEGVAEKDAARAGLDPRDPRIAHLVRLTAEVAGFPRHLSQHVGGFVITRGRLDELVPVTKAAMDGRTNIEWDKDDLDSLGILKIDVLALGMLTCVRKAFALLALHYCDDFAPAVPVGMRPPFSAAADAGILAGHYPVRMDAAADADGPRFSIAEGHAERGAEFSEPKRCVRAEQSGNVLTNSISHCEDRQHGSVGEVLSFDPWSLRLDRPQFGKSPEVSLLKRPVPRPEFSEPSNGNLPGEEACHAPWSGPSAPPMEGEATAGSDRIAPSPQTSASSRPHMHPTFVANQYAGDVRSTLPGAGPSDDERSFDIRPLPQEHFGNFSAHDVRRQPRGEVPHGRTQHPSEDSGEEQSRLDGERSSPDLTPGTLPGAETAPPENQEGTPIAALPATLSEQPAAPDGVPQYASWPVTMATIPPEDPDVYDMICRADTLGVFQIESRAQMTMLPRLRPRTFYDLVIEVAIVRPGPIQGDMVHPYLRRRQGREPVNYPSKELEQVLSKTLGVPLFQEQAMRIAIVAAGFTPSEADQLRRAMATFKKVGTIGTFQQKMIDGMKNRGYDPDFAERCFRQIEGFGEYGFPESHAASFALLVYASCWLKCHYPDVFCAALLNAQPMGFYAPAQIVRDARQHGVEVRPVDVNLSDWDCTLEEGPAAAERLDRAHASMKRAIRSRRAVRLGLRQVKGLNEDDMRRLVARRGAGYDSVRDVWLRTGLPRATIERLADADAFGSLGLCRRDALWAACGLDKAGRAEDLPLFAAADTADLQREAAANLPPMPPGEEVINDYRFLSLSLKAHPAGFVRAALAAERVVTAATLVPQANGRRVAVAGLVLVRQRPGSAKGVIFMTVEDETGIANVIVWPKVFEANRPIVLGARFVKVTGRIQAQDGVVHIVADRLEDRTPLLAALTEDSGKWDALDRADEVKRPTADLRTSIKPRSRLARLLAEAPEMAGEAAEMLSTHRAIRESVAAHGEAAAAIAGGRRNPPPEPPSGDRADGELAADAPEQRDNRPRGASRRSGTGSKPSPQRENTDGGGAWTDADPPPAPAATWGTARSAARDMSNIGETIRKSTRTTRALPKGRNFQ